MSHPFTHLLSHTSDRVRSGVCTFIVTLAIVAINSWKQQIFSSHTPDHTHAATFEARVQTAILPWPHVKPPHPSLETLTPGEPGAKTSLNVV